MTEQQWKELREKFWKECVDRHFPRDVMKVNVTPHNLFMWFREKIGTEPEPISICTACGGKLEITPYDYLQCEKCEKNYNIKKTI